jgi:hypothetical protein
MTKSTKRFCKISPYPGGNSQTTQKQAQTVYST